MLSDIDFKEKITLYIDDELSFEDKKAFEKTLDENKNLKSLYNQILANDILIKKMPDVKVSSDFMLNLNNRIDDYERKQFISWSYIKELLFNSKPAVGYSFASLVLIIGFSFFKLSDMQVPDFFISNTPIDTELSNYVAIHESDSTETNNDSLRNEILLIGNDR